jgi:hypothetical protein
VASRRVEFRIAHHSFSRWKYSQVDCFIANSAAIRDRLVADGIPRDKTTIVNEGVDVERIVKLPRPTCTPSCTCRRTRRSSATSRRSCRTRGSST